MLSFSVKSFSINPRSPASQHSHSYNCLWIPGTWDLPFDQFFSGLCMLNCPSSPSRWGEISSLCHNYLLAMLSPIDPSVGAASCYHLPPPSPPISHGCSQVIEENSVRIEATLAAQLVKNLSAMQ